MSDLSMMDLFREEVRAQTAVLGQGLIALEQGPAGPAQVEPLMRAAHSLKGAARIVQIDPAVQLAHVMEDVLVAAQEGRLPLAPPVVDVLLRANDVLTSLAEVADGSVADWAARRQSDMDDLKTSLRVLLAPAPGTPVADAPGSPAPATALVPAGDASLIELFRHEVRANAEALTAGLRGLEEGPPSRDRIEPLLQAAHSIRGAARIVQVDRAADLARAMEEVLSAVRDGLVALDADGVGALREGTGLLAELVQFEAQELGDWAGAQEQTLTRLRARLLVPAAVQAAPMPVGPAELAPPAAEKPSAPAEAVVRVTAQSLNRLMSLAGESLVQARWLQPFATALQKLKKQQDHLAGLLDGLAQALAGGGRRDQPEGLVAEARRQAALCRQVLAERIGEFEDHAAGAEDLNTRLYREVIVSRMRPFADGAHGFPRLVRDMARRLDKQVRLDIDGQDTEVDRDVLEKLEAPLTHLLRNAVDHGVEPPEVRRRAGKPETATLHLEVRHRAGMLAVTVSDDGAGVDIEALRKKVVERGLAAAEMAQGMADAELLEFLFLPGFSTAQALTEYSGRGVGLDVVQDTMRRVGGSVRITTTSGRGTRFHLQMPITLSVLRAVLVDIAGEVYAFPHNRIDGLVRIPRADIRSLERRQFVTIDGRHVGLVLAAQVLDLPGQPPQGDELPVLLMSDATGQYGLIVEAFRGEHDLVVRPLDPRLGKVPDVSAAAILDDGAPVLIADVEDMIRSMDHFIQAGSLRRAEREKVGAAVRKRVLVVDDSITVREVERQILAARGYDVSVAVDGQDGWNRVRGERFDLLITDVDMPRMTGLELVKAVRSEAALQSLPAIIVSYKEREEDRLRGLEVGASYYLTKSSFHDHTFVQAVVDLIGEP